jgi:hypothetical protein
MNERTVIDHLYAARVAIKRNLYEKRGGGEDRIDVWLHPSDLMNVRRAIDFRMLEPTQNLKLFAMNVKEDAAIPEGVAHLALNGTHVLTVDLKSGVIDQVDHPIPVSPQECAMLDSFFHNCKTVRVQRPFVDVAHLAPLSLGVDDDASPVSIKVYTFSINEMAERGLVSLQRHVHGWDVTLTWKGRMTLNNYRALAS